MQRHFVCQQAAPNQLQKPRGAEHFEADKSSNVAAFHILDRHRIGLEDQVALVWNLQGVRFIPSFDSCWSLDRMPTHLQVYHPSFLHHDHGFMQGHRSGILSTWRPLLFHDHLTYVFPAIWVWKGNNNIWYRKHDTKHKPCHLVRWSFQTELNRLCLVLRLGKKILCLSEANNSWCVQTLWKHHMFFVTNLSLLLSLSHCPPAYANTGLALLEAIPGSRPFCEDPKNTLSLTKWQVSCWPPRLMVTVADVFG